MYFSAPHFEQQLEVQRCLIPPRRPAPPPLRCAASSRCGTPDELKALIDEAHRWAPLGGGYCFFVLFCFLCPHFASCPHILGPDLGLLLGLGRGWLTRCRGGLVLMPYFLPSFLCVCFGRLPGSVVPLEWLVSASARHVGEAREGGRPERALGGGAWRSKQDVPERAGQGGALCVCPAARTFNLWLWVLASGLALCPLSSSASRPAPGASPPGGDFTLADPEPSPAGTAGWLAGWLAPGGMELSFTVGPPALPYTALPCPAPISVQAGAGGADGHCALPRLQEHHGEIFDGRTRQYKAEEYKAKSTRQNRDPLNYCLWKSTRQNRDPHNYCLWGRKWQTERGGR